MDKFKSWITSQGLTYREVGELVGVTKQTIYNYCAGRRKPEPERVRLIEKLSDGLVGFSDWWPPA